MQGVPVGEAARMAESGAEAMNRFNQPTIWKDRVFVLLTVLSLIGSLYLQELYIELPLARLLPFMALMLWTTYLHHHRRDP